MRRENPGQTKPPLPPIDSLLIDRNKDGFPDDVVGLLVVPEPLDDHTWAAVINLAARLGLCSSGFTPPIVAPEPLTGRVSITVRPGDAERLQSLATDRRDVQGSEAGTDSSEIRNVPDIDLSEPWTISGLLVDRDGDHAADDSAIHVHLPREIPFEVGAALAELAARIGVECSALTLPLAGGHTLTGRIPLSVTVDGTERARLERLHDGKLGLTGSPAALSEFVRDLASLSSGFMPDDPGKRAIDWLRRSIAGWTDDGRAAQVRASLAGNRPDRIVVLESNPELRQRMHTVATEMHPGIDVGFPEPRESVVFDHQWAAEWEVDRLFKTLNSEILPSLDPSQPVRLIAMVSEPRPVRRRVRGQITRRMLELGFLEGAVHVLDAFKPGLCWLQEVILPELRGVDHLDSINLRFRPWNPDVHEGQLDMPIRWLQELFPADEILARELGLSLERIRLESAEDQEAIYQVIATDQAGNTLLERSFSPLWRRIDYLSGMPDAGNVTVTTGGIIAEQAGETKRAHVLTDPEVFWRYVQGELQPNLRRYILTTTGMNPRSTDQPFFEDLSVDLRISASDEPYSIRQERHSAAEALHEDIYFNILDFVEELGQQSSGEKLSAPGSIRPFVSVTPGRQPEARIRLTSRSPGIIRMVHGTRATTIQPASNELPPRLGTTALEYKNGRMHRELAPSPELNVLTPFLRALAIESPPGQTSTVLRVELDDGVVEIGVPAPVMPEIPFDTSTTLVPVNTIISYPDIFAHLNRLAGHPSVHLAPAAEQSWQGRAIPAVAVTTPQEAAIWSMRKLSHFKPTILIVARHHANEVASTTSALQLIERSTGEVPWRGMLDAVNIVMLPLENPDGAALHDLLRQENPNWKHHPARYNATGYEFGEDQGNPDSQYGEGRIRDLVWNACLPDIVVDNHGVPSHEWAQLFAGFGSPPRFVVSYWQVQALLYGILPLDDLPGHREVTDALKERVAAIVAEDADLLHWNRIFTERYQTWGHQWVPDRFPLTLHREMLFHMNPVEPDSPRARRSYAIRYPKTTVVNWVTEVCDETVEGEDLERTARAHLLANRAALELLRDSASRLRITATEREDGISFRIGRERPLRVS